MKSYGIDMRGKFKLYKVSTLPTWSSADEGREIFVEDEQKRYYGTSTGWVDYSNAETASYVDAFINNRPHPNILFDNGRYAGTSALYNTQLSDVTAPFSQGVLVTYNGSTFSEAGKFIYDNNDFGGSSGSMTQTTIDLINTIGRSSGDARYGSEFRICGITAGSGTGSRGTFPGGTRYLMETISAYTSVAFSYATTFCSWIRAVGGTIGIAGGAGIYFSINGVEQPTSHYDLSPDDGWIFYTLTVSNKRGYDSVVIYVYGNNGTVAQLALSGMFNGIVKPEPFTCPVIGTVIS